MKRTEDEQKKGAAGLTALPGVGKSIAAEIEKWLIEERGRGYG